jgi:hypothetical protein
MIYRNNPRLLPRSMAARVADLMRGRDKPFRSCSGWCRCTGNVSQHDVADCKSGVRPQERGGAGLAIAI